MDDLISRQTVLYWLKNEWNGMVTSLFDGIKALPSAQPQYIARDIATIIENEKDMRVVLKQPRWIPCSERLPNKDGYYLTTTYYRQVYADYWNEDHFDRTEAVIAWMPLPEPYKGERITDEKIQ